MSQPWLKYLPPFLRGRLEGEEAVRRVVGNIGWQVGDHLLRMGIGLLLGIWIARYLGPEQFGLFSYALALVALVAPLAAVGLDDIAVRDLVRRPAAKEELLGTAFVLKLLGGGLSMAAAVATIALLRPGDRLSLWLVAILAAGGLFQAVAAIEFWFNAQVQAKYPVLARNVAFLVCAGARIALILGGAPLLAFAWISLLETVLGMAALVAAYQLRGHRIGAWRARGKTAAALLRDSWPLLCSCLVIAVYLRIDQVMLGELAGSEAVGVYSVAVRLAEVWFFFSAAVYWSFLPGLVESRTAGEDLFYARLQKYYNLMALSAYAVAVPVTFLADWLVRFLFGPAYAGAGPILAVLIWANLFIYLESARSAFFNVMNWYRLHLVTVAMGAALNVLLNFWLIPRHGGVGAAVASCIAYWFAAHGSCFLCKPLHRTGMMLTRAMFYPKVW